ncbi:IS200/IS605 family transposase [uncultured Methanolobus sp.]|uniref:IS200/IS605 family transposase n=1 Tax=uncultured Methanolobus sp. TaxID=218300 RepID=UPI00374A0560
MEYERKNHSEFLLLYHVIFVCKYRLNALIDIEKELKDSLLKIATKSNFEIVEMETDKDHIHLLIKSEPKYSILSIIRRLKQESTYRLWEQKESHLRHYYWGERTLWSDGYFCSTIGNVSKETVLEYIRNQG